MVIVQTIARHRNFFQRTFRNIVRNYSVPDVLSLGKKLKKVDSKVGAKTVDLPVEKDTKRLVVFVCGTNLLKESGEDVAIKPDSEYPDWLWTLNTGGPRPLSELDPNTLEYWERVRELGRAEKKNLASLYRQNRDYK